PMYSEPGKTPSSGAGLARREGFWPALAGAVPLLVLSDWPVFSLFPALSMSSALSVPCFFFSPVVAFSLAGPAALLEVVVACLLFGAAGEVSLLAEAAASLDDDACLAADALFSASSRLMHASCRSINWRSWRISSSRDCACVVCPAIG